MVGSLKQHSKRIVMVKVLPPSRVIAAKAQSGGWFSAFKGLVGNKKLTADDMAPVLEKMKENLIRMFIQFLSFLTFFYEVPFIPCGKSF